MKRTMLVGLLAVFAPVAAACGNDGPSASPTTTSDVMSPETTAPGTTAAETTTPETNAADTTAAEQDGPQRVVSLAPVHTEILFAIDAGEQVVATDNLSNFPDEALDVQTELSAYEPNIEAIAGFDPDLVVLSDDTAVKQLDQLGIETWVGPAAATFDDTYTQIEELGDLTGHETEAAALVEDMQTQIADLTADVPELDEPLTYYHELDDQLYSVTSDTFIGQVYDLFGLENIADASDTDGSGYPQLNSEVIVDRDPDLIFLADTVCCGQDADTIAKRPEWDTMSAVQNSLVFEMNDDIASRWGPRIVDYVRDVRAAVEKAVTTQPAN